MDGDIAPLIDIAELCTKYGAYLIVDEAHSGGVFGCNGQGLVSELKLEHKVFTRIITFGKAFGSHGACILCENKLKLFSRSFIYTTALPPDSYLRIMEVLKDERSNLERKKLKENIDYFRLKINLKWCVSDFNSPIQLIKIGDIELTKNIAEKMQLLNLAVKPIFSPTVPVGSEGLRICLHSFNTKEEIDVLIDLLD